MDFVKVCVGAVPGETGGRDDYQGVRCRRVTNVETVDSGCTAQNFDG